MKLLIVAMSSSIHIARWLSQITEMGWEIHLFPSIDNGEVHPHLKNVVVHNSFYSRKPVGQQVVCKGLPLGSDATASVGRKLLKKLRPEYRVSQLSNLIDKLRPDIIHSIEFQHAGYLTLEARKKTGKAFPTWIVTNWGSDIYLYGRLDKHEQKIRDVLGACDFYSCECCRDIRIAKEYGLKGEILPVIPNSGGFDLQRISKLRQPGPVSERKLIMLKGYQHWAGRALAGLRALERCKDLLKEYEIVIYSTAPEVEIAAELFRKSTGITVTIVPEHTDHFDILRLQGRARVSIGLSISDALSTSFLEALVMGAFPVQSYTACADEWIEDGKTGLLVHPEDTDVIEKALRRALTDDELVDQAAKLNYITARKRLDYQMLRQKTINLYKTVFESRNCHKKRHEKKKIGI